MIAQIIGGIVYANGIEYVWHRWVMHGRRSYFSRRHAEHHALVSAGAGAKADNALSLTWPVMLLFIPHAIVLHLLGWDAALITIMGYLIALEVTHRAQHRWPHLVLIGPWHDAHHEQPVGRYNTFLPLWDWILGTRG